MAFFRHVSLRQNQPSLISLSDKRGMISNLDAIIELAEVISDKEFTFIRQSDR